MGDYLLVKKTTNEIVSYCSSPVVEDGYRTVDLDAQVIKGHALPKNRKAMTGGKMTPAFTYVKPAPGIDMAAKRVALAEAKDSLLALDPSQETEVVTAIFEYLQKGGK